MLRATALYTLSLALYAWIYCWLKSGRTTAALCDFAVKAVLPRALNGIVYTADNAARAAHVNMQKSPDIQGFSYPLTTKLQTTH